MLTYAHRSTHSLRKIEQFQGYIGFLLIFLVGVSRTAELFSPNIHDATVYSSSTLPGSQPGFVIDEDFHHPHPTCFQTEAKLPDSNGYHWLLIDFETTVERVREIRLVTDQDNPLHGIDAYIINALDSSRRELNHTGSNYRRQTLSWDSPAFQFCATSEEKEQRGQTATIRCENLLNGRWLAIRRRESLNICLINIYVEHPFDDCFTPINNSTESVSGSVFRYVRHTPLDACRAACMREAKCEAVVFRAPRRRDSGVCQLVHSMEVNKLGPSERRLCLEGDENCGIDVNHCHGGALINLRQTSQAPSALDLTGGAIQEWKVQQPRHSDQNTAGTNNMILASVYFQGRLDCTEWNCGLLYIYAVDPKGLETLCTFVNTEHVVVMDKTSLFCDYTSPPRNTHLIRLKWRPPPPMEEYGGVPDLEINIYRAHLRVMKESLNAPIKKPWMSILEDIETTSESPSTPYAQTTLAMKPKMRIDQTEAPETLNKDVVRTDEYHKATEKIQPSHPTILVSSAHPRDLTRSKSHKTAFNFPINDQQQRPPTSPETKPTDLEPARSSHKKWAPTSKENQLRSADRVQNLNTAFMMKTNLISLILNVCLVLLIRCS